MLRMSMYILTGLITESEAITRKTITWHYKNMYMYYIYVSEISFDFNSMDMPSINWYNHKVFTVMFICIQYLLTFYGTYMNVFWKHHFFFIKKMLATKQTLFPVNQYLFETKETILMRTCNLSQVWLHTSQRIQLECQEQTLQRLRGDIFLCVQRGRNVLQRAGNQVSWCFCLGMFCAFCICQQRLREYKGILVFICLFVSPSVYPTFMFGTWKKYPKLIFWTKVAYDMRIWHDFDSRSLYHQQSQHLLKKALWRKLVLC